MLQIFNFVFKFVFIGAIAYDYFSEFIGDLYLAVPDDLELVDALQYLLLVLLILLDILNFLWQVLIFVILFQRNRLISNVFEYVFVFPFENQTFQAVRVSCSGLLQSFLK